MSDVRHTNRLAGETSPYLLQHAHNPVDWHPWGPEAFELARRENRPIFLSVGYSTCYWCHVMERECFENESIAAAMNAAMVNIKVDREERPDVDQLYMLAVQIMSRQGGWPMSVFLTPDLKPFYGGTYFPPTDHYGRPGFPRLIDAISSAFGGRRAEVERSAEEITRVLQKLARPPRLGEKRAIDKAWVRGLVERSVSDFDEVNGGFGTAPKFPRETLLELMLIHLRGEKDAEILRMLTRSLDAMVYGGIRDHLGGGFHRYSTDARWLVPHFEIMLYDNAMLLWVYAEVFVQTGEKRFATVARGIADFILREMTAASGGFYTALDAEVDGREGENYLWTGEQVREALAGEASAERFLTVYGLNEGPNFNDPHHGTGTPDRNVLFLSVPEDGGALDDEELSAAREILLKVRRGRKQPRLDNKILTSWNALMIRGLAHAGNVLGEGRYVEAATKCADYLLERHRSKDGMLLRVGGEKGAKQPGFLDDYAFLAQALLDLPGEKYRQEAAALTRAMKESFGAEGGGFYFAQAGAGDPIVRQMVGSDSPLPSGNGVAAMVLAAQGDWAGARGLITAFAQQIENGAESMSALLEAAMICVRQSGAWEAGGEGDASAKPASAPADVRRLAEEVVEIDSVWDGQALKVRCRVAAGYHLNAFDAVVEPTRLSVFGAEIERIEHPAGTLAGEFEITARLKMSSKAIKVNFSYQACNDQACLPPVTRQMEVSVD
jgi:uncharacterized protein YyaL (SSP411 family)